jgi:hypothetical protein
MTKKENGVKIDMRFASQVGKSGKVVASGIL